MKIPKKILQAPMDDLMSGNLKEVFKRNGYGGIPEWTSMGCAFFCYMDDRTCKDVKGKVHSIKMEYYDIDRCPLIRFDIVVYDDIINPLHFDAFLNIMNEDHECVLETLKEQDRIIFHWYDEDFKYKGSTSVKWKEENRIIASEIIEKSRECIRINGVKDFNRAKEKFMKKNTLD